MKVAGARAQAVEGDWQGTLKAGPVELRVVLHAISRDGDALKVEMKQLGANYSGTVDKERTTMTGTWSQLGNSLPLVLKRSGK